MRTIPHKGIRILPPELIRNINQYRICMLYPSRYQAYFKK
ncbi:hypothetical protein EC23916_A0432 [Escherichia coli 2.3916]|nr:hypothetical protein EC23916_A0432 [Escherichia coli 2.3916]